MSSESNFWLVTAPSLNFEDVPTVMVATYEVPLPAYWSILDLVQTGKPEDEVVQVITRHTGTKTMNMVIEIVSSIAENHRLVVSETPPPAAPQTPAPNRFSVAFKKSKRISDYRASRLEARRELQMVEEQLETAKQTEKKILNEAMILSQRKEEIKDMKMTTVERVKALSAVEQQIKQALQKHRDVEAEISHAKRLSVIHRASLA